jgi:hypothetical protein
MDRVGATILTSDSQNGRLSTIADPLPVVRQTVRAILLSSPAYSALDAASRRQMAEAMVKVCHRAALLIREEADSHQQAQAITQNRLTPAATTQSANGVKSPALSRAQSAGTEFSGVAAGRVAETTRQILNAVSFPRFVTDLINGVFKAMVDSNQQQMHSYVELLNNVAASTEGFADANFGPGNARLWLAERYPASFELAGDVPEEGEPQGNDEEPREITLRLRPGASWPSAEALKVDLGLSDGETAPTSGDPDRTLVPLARRALARQRQQMLATMVMLGMQRIVVESGRITASMRFHIDTRSAAQDDRASRFDFQNQISAAGSYGFGPWGVSASISNTIGYVSTQRTQTTEEMNTDLDLNSSVELNFKTDYLPLDRLSGTDRVNLIRANSLNPESEARIAADARTARDQRIAAQIESERARRDTLNTSLTPTPVSRPAPGQPGTVEAAERARTEAAQRERREGQQGQPEAGAGTGAGSGGGTGAGSGGGTGAGSGTGTGAGSGTGTGAGSGTGTGTGTGAGSGSAPSSPPASSLR